MSNSAAGNRYTMLINTYARDYYTLSTFVKSVLSVASSRTVFAELSRIYTKLVSPRKIFKYILQTSAGPVTLKVSNQETDNCRGE